MNPLILNEKIKYIGAFILAIMILVPVLTLAYRTAVELEELFGFENKDKTIAVINANNNQLSNTVKDLKKDLDIKDKKDKIIEDIYIKERNITETLHAKTEIIKETYDTLNKNIEVTNTKLVIKDTKEITKKPIIKNKVVKQNIDKKIFIDDDIVYVEKEKYLKVGMNSLSAMQKAYEMVVSI